MIVPAGKLLFNDGQAYPGRSLGKNRNKYFGINAAAIGYGPLIRPGVQGVS